jgi:TRAP-type C4-dicarboxylate transport system substrate-binding protein
MVYEKYLTPLYFKDVKVLWTGRYGPTNLLMASKPIRKLEDMKGKIMGFGGGRTPPLIFKALGAASESIQSADVYTSLEKKVIDGILFPLSTLRADPPVWTMRSPKVGTSLRCVPMISPVRSIKICELYIVPVV